MTRVLVVAGTPGTRAGLRALLEEAGVTVVGEAPVGNGGGDENSEPPEADVVLVAGEELLEEAVEWVAGDGSQALLVLAEDEHPAAVLRALPLRGWGLLPPDASPGEMEAAVAAVYEGLVVLPHGVSGRTLQSLEAVEEPDEPLTNREREVLALISQGLSNKLIARELHISEHTVKFHISSLYAKLGVSSRAGAVSRGARYGLISL